MSRNGAGIYNAPAGGSYPAASGTLIEASKFNVLIADMITALTESVARDGQTVTTANIPMAGFKITGLGNGTAASDAATVYQTLGTPQWCGTAGGTADALTLTPSPALGAYAAGVTFRFKAGAGANTGAATVNVSGLGAIAIQLNGAALAAGDIEASKWYQITLSDATTAQLQKIGFDNVDYLPLAGGTLTGGLTVSSGNLSVSSGVINEAEGSAVASAATINLDSATGNFLHVTGTTTITAVTLAQGAERTVVFDGALTLTHGASLILPSAANIATVAGDVAIFRGEGSSVTRCIAYNRADGSAVTGSAATQAQMEAASSNTVVATPGNVKWHPGAAKAYAQADITGSLKGNNGISSVTDDATGAITFNFSDTYSSVNDFTFLSTTHGGSTFASVNLRTTSSIQVISLNDTGALTDPSNYFIAAFGNLP